jgi:gamma-carbonic anhydrase
MADSHKVLDRLNKYLGQEPAIAETAFIAPNASILGAVTVGEYSSVWYQAVVRGDIQSIRIGPRTNIQDGSVLHVADDFPLTVGNDVTCGHRAIIHACTIGDRVLIGMGAIVLDGAEVGSDCIIGAQALVTKGCKLPAGSLIIGAPAKVARRLTDAERASITLLAEKYVNVAAHYRRRLKRDDWQAS